MNETVMTAPASNRLEDTAIHMTRIMQGYLNKLSLEEREQKIKVFKYMVQTNDLAGQC